MKDFGFGFSIGGIVNINQVQLLYFCAKIKKKKYWYVVFIYTFFQYVEKGKIAHADA